MEEQLTQDNNPIAPKARKNNNSLRQQIYDNMNLKATDELAAIWRTNNRFKWSDITFDVIREILKDRLGALPPQGKPKEQIARKILARKIRHNASKVSTFMKDGNFLLLVPPVLGLVVVVIADLAGWNFKSNNLGALLALFSDLGWIFCLFSIIAVLVGLPASLAALFKDKGKLAAYLGLGTLLNIFYIILWFDIAFVITVW